jgi:hypothetical protein
MVASSRHPRTQHSAGICLLNTCALYEMRSKTCALQVHARQVLSKTCALSAECLAKLVHWKCMHLQKGKCTECNQVHSHSHVLSFFVLCNKTTLNTHSLTRC